MTSFTIPPLAIGISLAAIFILSILIYLRATSEYFTSPLFKKSLVFLLVAYLALILLAFLLSQRDDQFVRIAVIPQVTSTEDSPITFWAKAESLVRGLDKHLPEDYLVYPSRWIMEAIDYDSLNNQKYLVRFANNIRLNHVIFFTEENNRSIGHLFNTGDKTEITFPEERPSVVLQSLIQAPERNHESWSIDEQQSEYLRASVAVSHFLKSKKHQKALDIARTLFFDDTTNVLARNLLAETQLTTAILYDYQGTPSNLLKLAALRICERTISRFDSSNAVTFRLLGRYYILEKMWARAEKFLVRSYRIDPFQPELYFDFSHLHSSRAKQIGYKNQEALLRQAIELNPCFERARLRLADYLYFNKWPGRAQDEINRLLKIHPTSIPGWLYLGKMAIGESKINEIIPIYNKILEIDPHNVEAFYNLGVYYYNSNDIENATRFFERAVLYGDHLDSHLYLGHIYQSRGELERAIAEYRYRIKYKKGLDDPYADEARKRLYNLTNADSALDAYYGRKK